MPQDTPFMVLLRGNIPADDLEVLAPLIHEATRKPGNIMRALWCRAVDSSQSNYLYAEAKFVAEEDFISIRLPHWAVLSIVDSRNFRPIGFVWGESPHKPPEQE